MDAADPPAAEPTAQLASELRGLIGKLKRRLREQGSAGDLTPSQIAVIQRLEKHGPATASGLARAEGMRPQSMAAVIGVLDAAGMVSGAPDPSDGRQTLLSLTEACRRRLQEGRAARQDWLTKALEARLSAEEQAVVAEAVALLRRLADD